MLMPEARIRACEKDVRSRIWTSADALFFSSVGSARVIHLVALHELHLSHRQQSQLRWTLEEHHGGNAQQEPHDLLHHGDVVQLVAELRIPQPHAVLSEEHPAPGQQRSPNLPVPPLTLPPPPASSFMRHPRRCRRAGLARGFTKWL